VLGPQPASAGGRRAPGQRTPAGAAIRLVSTLLLLFGLALVSDVGAIVVWQEPVSALYARVQQDRLAGQVAREESVAPSSTVTQQLERLRTNRQRVALLAAALRRTAPRGAGVGRLNIPSLGVGYLLVNGADTESLKKGPGIYSQTPFPGSSGTTAVAGHRTTYLAPFRNVDRLRPGQKIVVQMPYAELTYAVEMTRIVDPTDFSVIKPVGYPRLVLSACDPPFSAAKRIIIFSRLIHTAVRGKAFKRAALVAPIKTTGPGVAVLVLAALLVLVVVPLVVFGLVSRLARLVRRRG
jgi:sortase A